MLCSISNDNDRRSSRSRSTDRHTFLQLGGCFGHSYASRIRHSVAMKHPNISLTILTIFRARGLLIQMNVHDVFAHAHARTNAHNYIINSATGKPTTTHARDCQPGCLRSQQTVIRACCVMVVQRTTTASAAAATTKRNRQAHACGTQKETT